MSSCTKCRGKGYLDGIEHACPDCNPGGEWRSSEHYPDQESFEPTDRQLYAAGLCYENVFEKSPERLTTPRGDK